MNAIKQTGGSMKVNKFMSLVLCLIIVASVTGCSSTTVARDFNGLSTPAGSAEHLSTSNIAIHGLFGVKPMWGNATLEKTVSDFTAAAKSNGASKVQIVQSNVTKLWFIFPPISFFVTPVFSNVAGDAVK